MRQNGKVLIIVMANIWISQQFIDEIITDIEKYAPLETGGIFFGYCADNGDVVVTDLIDAGADAKRSGYSFEPEQEYQLAEIERLFILSNGKTTYLGDWHSHPDSSPVLSRKDEITLLKIALSTEARCPAPIMVVVGSQPEKWSFNCVKFIHGKKKMWPFYSCHYETLRLIID